MFYLSTKNEIGVVRQLDNNERVDMTRRFPRLNKKVLYRDSVIAKKIIAAYDVDHDPPKVLAIFLKEQKNLSDERYWELLRTVWIVSGNTDNAGLFRKLMQSNRKEKYYFSTPEDAKVLRELPDYFEVYRAGHEGDGGLSWTLSREYAEKYQVWYKKEKILVRTVTRNEVFAYIQRNLESEIVIL